MDVDFGPIGFHQLDVLSSWKMGLVQVNKWKLLFNWPLKFWNCNEINDRSISKIRMQRANGQHLESGSGDGVKSPRDSESQSLAGWQLLRRQARSPTAVPLPHAFQLLKQSPSHNPPPPPHHPVVRVHSCCRPFFFFTNLQHYSLALLPHTSPPALRFHEKNASRSQCPFKLPLITRGLGGAERRGRRGRE